MHLIEPEPHWRPLYLRCRGCGETWQDWQPVEVRVNVWLSCMEGVRCPVCASDLRRINVLAARPD